MQLRKLIRCRRRECGLKACCSTVLSSSVVLLRSAGGVIGFTVSERAVFSDFSIDHSHDMEHNLLHTVENFSLSEPVTKYAEHFLLNAVNLFSLARIIPPLAEF